MTLPITSKHRLVLKDYEAIINAGKTFAAEPQLAETTQVIIINEEEDEEDEEKSMTPREKTNFVPSQPF